MKYGPIKNKPNVSRTRFPSVSPSFRLDSRGYPHIAWIEKKSGNNEINYSFWDGLKWSYNDTPFVSISNENINYSPNGIILDTYENPIIVFSKKIEDGNRLYLTSYSSQWDFIYCDVDYGVDWIGIAEYNKPDNSSSSSADSSSSSSLVISESSSSSSIDGKNFYVFVYDQTNSEFNVYSVGDYSWSLLSSITIIISDVSKIKISSCGVKIAVSFVEEGYISYNFFDLVSSSWKFEDFNYFYDPYGGSIIDFDIKGYYNTKCIASIAWMSKTSSYFYINSAEFSEDQLEYPWPTNPISLTNYNVEQSSIDLNVDDNYIVNGYRKIGVVLKNGSPSIILVTGSRSKMFSLEYGDDWFWDIDLVDIEGISNGIVSNSIMAEYSDNLKLVLEADSGDVYYFEETSPSSFFVATPNIALLSKTYSYHAYFSEGNISSGENITGLYDNQIGSMLSDVNKPLLITVNNNTIRTADLNSNNCITSRDISGNVLNSIDVNQIDGRILVTDYSNNKVIMYPQSYPLQVTEATEFTTFNRYGSLNYPLDARFDYCVGKIWIADTYNHRILKVDPIKNRVDLNISGDVYYPYSLISNLNDGGVFVRGYVSLSLTREIIYYYNKDGDKISSFEFGREDDTMSSSSSSSQSSSSSSSKKIEMPSVNLMAYDHSRSRLWWLCSSKIYMADTRNYQVQTYDVSSYSDNVNTFSSVTSIKVDLKSGNSFVVVTNQHNNKYLIQMSRDNNEVLAVSYLEL